MDQVDRGIRVKVYEENWRKQHNKWMGKWGINWQDCPNSKVEIKNWVLENFQDCHVGKTG